MIKKFSLSKWLAVLLCLFVCLSVEVANAAPETVSLDGSWKLSQADRHLSIKATVPGVVDADLLTAKLIPDPYYRDNLTKIQWVGQVPWTYSRQFVLTKKFMSRRHILLRCLGLDTLAHIRINGKDFASTDNMFRTWEFNIKPSIHVGTNVISITFDPVEPYLEAHVNQAAFPGKTVEVHGWGYIRKPPYQPGWDFAPDLVTCGIWRDISVLGWDDGRIEDIWTVQTHQTSGVVNLAVKANIDANSAMSAIATLTLNGRLVMRSKAPVTAGTVSTSLTISHPLLWWPSGMGAQTLYNLRVDLVDSSGKIQDTTSRTLGLRTITWLPKTATMPLTLEVNGHPFFAKGTNWVPCDAIMTRTTPQRLRNLVDSVASANMNIMRLWGGGFYEDNALFDECDKRGILLWSEFKFADSAYPAFDPVWLANVSAEVRDNVHRLIMHPSIAVWSGNNEVIGFVRDTTYAGAMSKTDYDLLFHQTIPTIIHSIDPSAVYTPGSPESGDEHDWSVWHGDSGFESYRDVHGFVSEFGFQAFPANSVDQFTSTTDRSSVETPVMEFHQHNWRDGNLLILNTAKRYYRSPKDFDSALWLSQINQADGILTGVEHWRRDWPNSTGSLVWQFDDPWPAISWSMMDYYSRPKALYYRLKHAYAPVMLSGIADSSTKTVNLWVANDRYRKLKGELKWLALSVNGSIEAMGSSTVSVQKGTSSTLVGSIDQSTTINRIGLSNLIFIASLKVPGEADSTTTLLFVKPKHLNLMAPEFKDLSTGSHRHFTVQITDARPALDVWIDLGKYDATFSDNFFTVVPGIPITVSVKTQSSMTLAEFDSVLRINSLYSTYLPSSTDPSLVIARIDGSVIATADQADIVGDGTAHVEFSNPSDIGNWSDSKDSLEWQTGIVPAGTYSVSINYSCPVANQGSHVSLNIGDHELDTVVPGTAGWTDYKDLPVGSVTFDKPESSEITLRPLTMPGGYVMNLRSIKLTPATAQQ